MVRLYHTFLGVALWASVLTPPVSRAADIKIACIGDSITLSSNLGAMTFPARLDGPLGAGYVVRNYPTEKRRFPLLEAGPIRTEPRMEPRYRSDHAAYQRFQNIQLGSCRRICP